MARVVVKFGTSTLTDGKLALDIKQMQGLADQCARIRAGGHEVILCSSGAIAAGRDRMGFDRSPKGLPERQMLAAVGQARIMRTWESLFDAHGVRVGQVLLTRADVEDRRRFLNARDALEAMLAHGVIPIANENDAVATSEIRLGDNDALSGLLAVLSGADLLVMLTDQPGLFTSDPRKDPTARLIPEIHAVDDAMRAAASGSVSGVGTGGMATKLAAAEIAGRAGTTVVVASGRAEDVIVRAVEGKSVGTRFLPTVSPLEHRKRWILAGPAVRAQIVADQGAVRAITEAGKSLLPAGLLALNGSFLRGDTVGVVSEDGRPVARGIIQYDDTELSRILGVRSDEIAGILGYSRSSVVIHRNDLVVDA